MMKKLICILCVLSTVFLFSCNKAQQSAEKENTAKGQSDGVVAENSDQLTTQADNVTETTVSGIENTADGENKFNLTNIRRSGLSQKQYEAYKVIIGGMDLGKTQIKVDLTDAAGSYNRVRSALWSGYPLYALVQDMYYSHNTKMLNITYAKSGSELTNAIKAFYDKVGTIVTKELLAKDNFSKTLLIYDYVAGGTPSGDSTATVYDFIMNGKGTDIGFSMAYEYLLGLAGVECNHVSGEVGDRQISLTQVKIGNSFYYMSPYKEASENGGKKLKFFGMTDERAKTATGAKEFFSVNNEYSQVSVPLCNNSTFSFTSTLESWTLDTAKKELSYVAAGKSYAYKY